MPDLTPVQWCLAIAAGLLVGFAKTGIAGIGILAIPLMAMAFGAKASVGALLPMLIVGDFIAVGYYRRHAVWPCLVSLLPWVGVGLALGFLALGPLKGPEMQLVLGTLILALVGLQAARKRFGEWAEHRLPHTWWFSAVIGVLAGFATMLANAAGPIMVLYFLTRKLPKKEFIGTGAWYYLIVNLIKAPLFCTRGMITADSLLLNAWMGHPRRGGPGHPGPAADPPGTVHPGGSGAGVHRLGLPGRCGRVGAVAQAGRRADAGGSGTRFACHPGRERPGGGVHFGTPGAARQAQPNLATGRA